MMSTAALALTLALLTSWHSQGLAAPATVVFVCEHGAAKSLIATLYFNQLAAERGLAARAAFRGVDPQDALSVRAAAASASAQVPAVPEVVAGALGPAHAIDGHLDEHRGRPLEPSPPSLRPTRAPASPPLAARPSGCWQVSRPW